MVAIRGAITIDGNTIESIKQNAVELVAEIVNANSIQTADIISMQFSVTADITKASPAKFIREEMGLASIAYFTTNEAKIDNDLPFCIRVLVLVNNNKLTQGDIKHIYLKGAKKLRSDI
ncbi:MAG: chorismate mutase [Firmicutes bacterium]|nr:chorismate mutase [Bacillota bacterium]